MSGLQFVNKEMLKDNPYIRIYYRFNNLVDEFIKELNELEIWMQFGIITFIVNSIKNFKFKKNSITGMEATHCDDGSVIIELDGTHHTYLLRSLQNKFAQECRVSLYKQIMIHLVRRGLTLRLNQIPIELQDDINVMKEFAKTDFTVFEALKHKFNTDKEVILECLTGDKVKRRSLMPHHLKDQLIDPSLHMDKEFILELIRRNPEVLYLVPKEREYVLEAMKHSIKYLGFLPGQDRKTESFIWELFLKDSENLKFASSKLLNSPFAFKIKEHDEKAFKKYCGRPRLSIHARDDYRLDREFVLKGIYYGMGDFGQIKKKFRKDAEFKMVNGISQDASLWKLKDDWKNDKEMILKHIDKNKDILKYVNPNLLEDYEFMTQLLYKNVECIQYLSDNVKDQIGKQENSIQNLVKHTKFKLLNYFTKYITRDDIISILPLLNQPDSFDFLTIVNKSIFCKDIEIFQLATKQNYNNFHLFSEGLKSDKQNILDTLNIISDETVFGFLKQVQRSYFCEESEILLFAIKHNSECFTLASLQLKSDLKFIKDACHNNLDVFKHYNYSKMDRELTLLYVKATCKGYNSEFFEKLNFDEEILLVFVGHKLNRVEDRVKMFKKMYNYESLRKNEEFCGKLLNIDLDNYTLIEESILPNFRNVFFEKFTQNSRLSSMPIPFQNDKQFIRTFIRSNSFMITENTINETYFEILLEELKLNPNIYEKIYSETLRSNEQILLIAATRQENHSKFPYHTIYYNRISLLPLLKKGIILPYYLTSYHQYKFDADFVLDNFKDLIK